MQPWEANGVIECGGVTVRPGELFTYCVSHGLLSPRSTQRKEDYLQASSHPLPIFLPPTVNRLLESLWPSTLPNPLRLPGSFGESSVMHPSVLRLSVHTIVTCIHHQKNPLVRELLSLAPSQVTIAIPLTITITITITSRA